MKNISIFSFVAILISSSLFISCEDEELTADEVALIVDEVIKAQPAAPTLPVETDKYAFSGNIISAITENTDESTTFVKYFESDIPNSIDASSGTAFAAYFPRSVYKNQIFNTNPNGNARNNLFKLQINKETGVLEATDEIVLTNNLQTVRIIDDKTGVFTITGELKLFVFNPSTMKITDIIDIPNAQRVATNDDNHYVNIQYRKNDNRIFLALYTDLDPTPAFYDATTVWVEVINFTTRQWEKTISFDNAQYPVQRGANNNMVDEEGNVYILCQGSYGLDGKASINSTQDSRPQFLKIPAGRTDFDPDYSFNPVLVNNPLLTGNFAQFVTGPILDNDGNGYAAISALPDSPRVLELLEKLAGGTITPAEFGELRRLVLSGATSKWAKLNFDAQSVELLDIPATAGFGFPMSHKYGDGDLLYFNAFDPSNNLNAIYEYNPATNTSKVLYNITAGGQAISYVKLTD